MVCWPRVAMPMTAFRRATRKSDDIPTLWLYGYERKQTRLPVDVRVLPDGKLQIRSLDEVGMQGTVDQGAALMQRCIVRTYQHRPFTTHASTCVDPPPKHAPACREVRVCRLHRFILRRMNLVCTRLKT